MILSACNIEQIIEPLEAIECPHSIVRDGEKFRIEIKSNEPYVDICLSTSPRDKKCTRHLNVYFQCINKSGTLDPTFIEIFYGEKYCCQLL